MAKHLNQLQQQIIACNLCERLVQHRQTVAQNKRAAYRNCDYWGKPVPGFGDPAARLLIIGLAPAAHGGNRTGRMFTGDGSAAFLMQGLYKAGFANQPNSVSLDDGLVLYDAYMLAVARCAPPANKLLPSEIANCRTFLLNEIALLPNVHAVLALGKVAMAGYLAALAANGYKVGRMMFYHGAAYEILGLPRLFVSYHPSRQNTQTGKLTVPMFDEVLQRIASFLANKAN